MGRPVALLLYRVHVPEFWYYSLLVRCCVPIPLVRFLLTKSESLART